jgi:hypothetical protein
MDGPRRLAIVTGEQSTIQGFIEHSAWPGVELTVDGQTIIRTSSGFSYFLYVLRATLRSDFFEHATTLPLDSVQVQNGGSLALLNGGIVLTTLAQPWAYAASAPLPLPVTAAGPAMLLCGSRWSKAHSESVCSLVAMQQRC